MRRIDLPHVTSFILELPVSRNCRLDSMTELMTLLFFIPIYPNESLEEWKFDSSFELIDISCALEQQDLAGFMDEKPRPPETLIRISSGQELIVENVRFDILQHLRHEDFIIVSFTQSVVNIDLLQKYNFLLLELTIVQPENVKSVEQFEEILQVAGHVKHLELKVSIPNLHLNLARLDGWSMKTLKIFNTNHGLEIYGGKTFLNLRELEIGSSSFPTHFNPTTLVTPRLKTLHLFNTVFSASGVTFLKSLKTLETFNAAEMEVDVSQLPTTHLQRLEFESNVKVDQSGRTYFPQIKTFKMDSSCELSLAFVSSFAQTFKHARTVIVSGTKNRISPEFFFQVLNTSTTYFIFRFNRHSANLTAEQKKVSLLLLEFGVPDDYSLNSLILTRDSKHSPWSWSYANFSRWDTFLYFWYPISIGIVSVFGIIGNLLNGIILFRKPIQSSTTCILLCLTLSDLILLSTSLNLIPYSVSNGFRHRHKLPPNVFPGDLFLKNLEVFLFYPLRLTGGSNIISIKTAF